MRECVNALVGLIVMVEGVELWNRKGTLRDRRGTVEGSPKGLLGYMVKIRKLWLFMGGLCNTLIFRWCVVAAKKAQRTHIEGSKKGYHQGTAERSPKDCQQIVQRYLCRRRCRICATIRRNATIVRKQKTYKLWQHCCHNSDATLLLQIKH